MKRNQRKRRNNEKINEGKVWENEEKINEKLKRTKRLYIKTKKTRTKWEKKENEIKI